MNEKSRIFVKIYTKRNLSPDELVDAFREAGVINEDPERTHHSIVRIVSCSDNPIATIDSFQETIDEVKKVVGDQFKVIKRLE